MDPKLKAALAKAAADLTEEEKDLIADNFDDLTDEQKAAFADCDPGASTKALTELIRKEISEAKAGNIDKAVESILAKFEEKLKAAKTDAVTKAKPADRSKAESVTRNFMKAVLMGDRDAIKSMTTATDDSPKAGYTIPTELLTEVLRIANKQYGLARRDMRYLPFTGPGNTRKIPTVGTVAVNWTDEGAKIKSTGGTFGLVEQTLKKLAAIVPFTEELLEDTGIDLTGLISELIAEALSKEEDEQFFNGDGTVWTGVLQNSDVNSVTMDAGRGFADITAEDLLDMIDETPTGALQGSKFYMHRSVLSRIRRLKADTSGQYIFQSPGGGLPNTIWDYPYEVSDAFPAVGDDALDTAFVLFGNLKTGAIIGDKQNVKLTVLTEATITDTDNTTQINLAEQDCIAFRFVERVGYLVAVPKALTVLKTNASAS